MVLGYPTPGCFDLPAPELLDHDLRIDPVPEPLHRQANSRRDQTMIAPRE
jgi:hypothetical protein